MTRNKSNFNRRFLSHDLQLEHWEDIKAYYENLRDRELADFEAMKQWLKDRSELDAFVSEDLAWRYIAFTCNSLDQEALERYQYFMNKIQPEIAPFEDVLNQKLIGFRDLDRFEAESYRILFKSVKREIALFREENIPIFTEISNISKTFNTLSSDMTIEHDGTELTLQQASRYYEDLDRTIRKEVYDKVIERRMRDHQKLDQVFSELVEKRTQVARNAGFDNFRDYKFESLKRFDYSIEDNLAFHKSIQEEIVPLLGLLHKKRKDALGFDSLKPYDLHVDTSEKPALNPFETGTELIEGCITIFDNLGNLGHYLRTMQEGGFLDLDSRKGKSPGGYNYPLSETGIPFIFMNASGQLRDLVTMVHEGGHAIHSFLAKDLELVYFKHTPSEVAELASMSMELMTMDYWSEFFNEEDLKRARLKHLESVLEVLPWVAIIDKFQHWVYTHPEHSVEERDAAWVRIFTDFSSGLVDYTGYEAYLPKMWQMQMHLFEVPFYYIEYAIAQLGAIAVWKNFRSNKELGLKQYLNALKLGYTKSIPEIYKTAGIRFDFSRSYLKELADFVRNEINTIE